MTQIDDFFMYENRVEGITDADYQRARPYVEAAQAFAQTTYRASTSSTTTARISSTCRTIRSSSAATLPTRYVRWATAIPGLPKGRGVISLRGNCFLPQVSHIKIKKASTTAFYRKLWMPI